MKRRLNTHLLRSRRALGGLFIALLVVVGLFFLLTIRGQTPVIANKLGVVAAENFWGNIASQIGGAHAHVTSIITDPNADPHLYESSARDAYAVASTRIVIVNGVGYDDFMNKLLSASQNPHRQVVTIAAILHASQNGNPHLWYDVMNISLVAQAIANNFIAVDPAHANDYLSNLKVFDQTLQPVLQLISNIKQRYVGTPVAYTEPLPGYLLTDIGLANKTPVGFAKSIEDGTDPSPADTALMDTLITTRQVRLLLYNAQATSPVTEQVKTLALQADIPVIALTETMPAHEQSYQSWQLGQLNQILTGLEK